MKQRKDYEAHLAYTREWRKRNRERLREYDKQYVATHPETKRKIVLRAKLWMKKQPRDRYRNWRSSIDQRRRARKLGATIGVVNLAQALIDYNGNCGICDKPLEDSNIHLDHIIPLSKGGAHVQSNIQPSHAICNILKGNKLVTDNCK